MFGATLIVVGVIFLLKNLGIISGVAWDIIWPTALIAFGLVLIFKRHRLGGF